MNPHDEFSFEADNILKYCCNVPDNNKGFDTNSPLGTVQMSQGARKVFSSYRLSYIVISTTSDRSDLLHRNTECSVS